MQGERAPWRGWLGEPEERASARRTDGEKVRRAQRMAGLSLFLSLSLPLHLSPSRSLEGWNVTRFEEAVGWTRRWWLRKRRRWRRTGFVLSITVLLSSP